ncbi:MAG: tetraacyldisaccharide 4'-kinase [Myxococcaceae bacterium]
MSPLSAAWSLVVRGWHLTFDTGLRQPTRVAGAQVVSVGNLVVGGAGKTPVVIHLANEAMRRGYRVAVLTRGYGRTSREELHITAATLRPVEEVGDEPRLIARRCPGVTVWVGADRVSLARQAIAGGANLLLLDDGFQHRRLARDVDVLVDGGEGNGWVLPAGPLREPASHRARATHLWGRDGREGDVTALHHTRTVRAPDGVEHPLATLVGKPLTLLLGIARPERVVESLRDAGLTVKAVHAHADHHVFTAAELDAARRDASDGLLVTTEKDAERLAPGSAWVLIHDVEVKNAKRHPLDALKAAT